MNIFQRLAERILDRAEDRRAFEREAGPHLRALSGIIPGGLDSLLLLSDAQIEALDPATLALLVKFGLWLLNW